MISEMPGERFDREEWQRQYYAGVEKFDDFLARVQESISEVDRPRLIEAVNSCKELLHQSLFGGASDASLNEKHGNGPYWKESNWEKAFGRYKDAIEAKKKKMKTREAALLIDDLLEMIKHITAKLV